MHPRPDPVQKPTDTTSLRVKGQYRDFNGTARVFRANLFVPGSNDLRGLASAAADFDRGEVQTDGLNFQRMKLYEVASTFEWDLGPATLTSVTSWWSATSAAAIFDGGNFASSGLSSANSRSFAPRS